MQPFFKRKIIIKSEFMLKNNSYYTNGNKKKAHNFNLTTLKRPI